LIKDSTLNAAYAVFIFHSIFPSPWVLVSLWKTQSMAAFIALRCTSCCHRGVVLCTVFN